MKLLFSTVARRHLSPQFRRRRNSTTTKEKTSKIGRILILTRFPPEYEPQRLAKAARKKGIEPEIVNYQDISIEGEKVLLPRNLKLKDFGFVIPRSAAHRHKKSLLKEKMALIKALPQKSVCLNKTTYLRLPKLGKIKQTEILNKHNLPTIPTLEKPIFPAILKAEFGSHSRRVIKVENQKQANKAMECYQGKWFYQPLIKSPVYWRVIVLDGKFLGVMERKTSKRFLQSGEGEKPEINRKEIKTLAIKATKVFQAEFTGVDLFTDKNKLMIIEVNRSPQFRIFERLTKVKVAEELIDYLTITSE